MYTVHMLKNLLLFFKIMVILFALICFFFVYIEYLFSGIKVTIQSEHNTGRSLSAAVEGPKVSRIVRTVNAAY